MAGTYSLLGVNVSLTTIYDACQTIERWIGEKRRMYVCVAPVSTIVECQHDVEYKRIVNCAGMVTPDGMPLVWLGRLRGHKNIERTYGPDLMRAFCKLSEEKGYRHFLYGGSEQSLLKLITKLKELFPRLNIVGSYAPGELKVRQKEDQDIIQKINDTTPDVLWVGLGSPKQDFWMSIHQDELKVPVMVGAGAAFDFISGLKPQAPRWMQRCGLEWFFRLCSEPQRLWKRYLIGNTLFIYYLLRNSLARKS